MRGEYIFAGYLILLSLFDIKSGKLPKKLLLVGALFAAAQLFYLIWDGQGGYGRLLAKTALGMLPGFLLIVFSLATKKVGAGDGCVLVLMGTLIGAEGCFLIFSGSLFLAAAYAGILFTFCRKGRNSRFPFIPFVTAAFCIWMIMST